MDDVEDEDDGERKSRSSRRRRYKVTRATNVNPEKTRDSVIQVTEVKTGR